MADDPEPTKTEHLVTKLRELIVAHLALWNNDTHFDGEWRTDRAADELVLAIDAVISPAIAEPGHLSPDPRPSCYLCLDTRARPSGEVCPRCG